MVCTCFKCAYAHTFACMAVFWSLSWIILHNPWTMKENCEAKTKPIFKTPISSLQRMCFLLTNAVRVCACVCVRTCVWIRIHNGSIIAKNHFLSKSIFCLILILIIIATFNKYFFPFFGSQERGRLAFQKTQQNMLECILCHLLLLLLSSHLFGCVHTRSSAVMKLYRIVWWLCSTWKAQQDPLHDIKLYGSLYLC